MQAILSIPKPYNPALSMQHLPTFWFGDVKPEIPGYTWGVVPVNVKHMRYIDSHGLSVSNA